MRVDEAWHNDSADGMNRFFSLEGAAQLFRFTDGLDTIAHYCDCAIFDNPELTELAPSLGTARYREQLGSGVNKQIYFHGRIRPTGALVRAVNKEA
jgi:hypothetical protein